jgi:hypothetical protein
MALRSRLVALAIVACAQNDNPVNPKPDPIEQTKIAPADTACFPGGKLVPYRDGFRCEYEDVRPPGPAGGLERRAVLRAFIDTIKT